MLESLNPRVARNPKSQVPNPREILIGRLAKLLLSVMIRVIRGQELLGFGVCDLGFTAPAVFWDLEPAASGSVHGRK